MIAAERSVPCRTWLRIVTNSSFGFLTGTIDFSFSKLFVFWGIAPPQHSKKADAIFPAQMSIAFRVRTVRMSGHIQKFIAFRAPLVLGISPVVWERVQVLKDKRR